MDWGSEMRTSVLTRGRAHSEASVLLPVDVPCESYGFESSAPACGGISPDQKKLRKVPYIRDCAPPPHASGRRPDSARARSGQRPGDILTAIENFGRSPGRPSDLSLSLSRNGCLSVSATPPLLAPLLSVDAAASHTARVQAGGAADLLHRSDGSVQVPPCSSPFPAATRRP
jgi:hypothetical protein